MSKVRKLPLLFQEFPKLKDHIPWMPLTRVTPVQKLKKLGKELDLNELWVKRDDMTSDIYGGNKPRKLEFVLAEALQQKKTKVITYGGTGSNHCLATLLFAKKYGLETILVLWDQPVTAHVQRQLLLFKSLGAQLIHLNEFDYNKLPDQDKIYNIGPGGTSPLGILGYVEAALELKKQVDEGLMPEPELIFVAAGSLGTQAGLELGIRLCGLRSKVMGVRVTAKEFANADLVATYARDSYTLIKDYLGGVPEPDFRDVTVLDDYAGAEYGAVTQDGLAAIELMKKTEGIQLETTYTGKTLAGLIDYTKKHDLKDTPILFWNTYNSVDVSKYLKRGITYRDLPEVFHKNFKEDLLHKK
ncbi:MAG: pyridoxal-phosphate dependent enzyme [Candidatus Freyarchaeota archaeon]|nr:pyridoxal-phosphate dependent enzyme [Candidatus Jordarchaeia archaeon]